MNNMIMQMLMNKAKQNNPQIFNLINNSMNNNINPINLFNQITKGYSQEQKNNIFQIAKQYGINDETINKFKN